MKNFIEAYGGEIFVESRTKESHPDNHGTEFHVLLSLGVPLLTTEAQSEKKGQVEI